MKISVVLRRYKEIFFQGQRIAINDISKSKMISRRQGGGSADVYENRVTFRLYVEEADDAANKDSALI